MESKFNRGKEILVEKLDLPKDVLLDVPKIIVIGRNEVTIENHKGIMIFERDKIKINYDKNWAVDINLKLTSFLIYMPIFYLNKLYLFFLCLTFSNVN